MGYPKGTCGNPGGIGGRRARLRRRVDCALQADFEEHGVDAIRRLREENVGKYMDTIISRLPKDPANVNVNQSGTVTHEHINISALADRVADALRARAMGVPEGTLPH